MLRSPITKIERLKKEITGKPNLKHTRGLSMEMASILTCLGAFHQKYYWGMGAGNCCLPIAIASGQVAGQFLKAGQFLTSCLMPEIFFS